MVVMHCACVYPPTHSHLCTFSHKYKHSHLHTLSHTHRHTLARIGIIRIFSSISQRCSLYYLNCHLAEGKKKPLNWGPESRA